ncbi:hypothetical protein [Fictibacillus gelatini]|uniref:hypothetical protein n=1 Tax=Fictibacillus gelatini TaxID=225985 RepID=UPI00040E0B2D|nr:hypothetical protein [Fictibacillus gelatini]
MKKLATMALAGSLLLGGGAGAAHVFAKGDTEVKTASPYHEKALQKATFSESLKKEFHEASELKYKQLGLKQEIVKLTDKLRDLHVDAVKNGNKTALKEARKVKVKIKDINKEIKQLNKTIHEERKALKEAVKAKNKETARTHLQKLNTLKTSVNKKLEQKVSFLNEMIDILQK